MLKVKEYKVYGDDDKYTELVLVSEQGDEITFSKYNETGRITLSVDGEVNYKLVKEAIEFMESGKLEITL